MRHERDNPNVGGVYGRGNIVTAANGPHKSLDVEGLSALDLATTKSNGEHWDFSRRSHRDAARRMVADLEPTWLIGSPPCTTFSSWQYVNYALLPPEEVERKKNAGLVHLKYVAQLYKEQVKGGRHLLHEHPLSAMSWSEPCMQEIMAIPGVGESLCDQCRCGCRAVGTANSPPMYGKKATRFISNSTAMLSQLGRRWDGGHEHKQLRGKDLAEAAFYPAELVHAIVRGMNLTHGADLVKSLIDDKCDPLTRSFSALPRGFEDMGLKVEFWALVK